MSRKTAKAASSPDIPNVELRRLALEEDKVELEKAKFKHQKQMEEQRLNYEVKKEPPALTKWHLIASLVVGPLLSAIVIFTSALFGFQIKGTEIKSQEALKMLEMKNQEALKIRDLQSGMTMHLISNLKFLNSMPLQDRRNIAQLIKGVFPEHQSFQILDMFERNSPPATRGIWREAKAQIASEQITASQACQAVPSSQENKTSDLARLINSTHSTSSPWADNSTASITDLLYGATKPVGGLFAGGNTRPSTDLGYINPTDTKFSVLPASFKEGVGMGDAYPIGQPSYLKSAGLQVTATPGALMGSQITVTLTEGNMANPPYQLWTPSSVNVTGAQRLGLTVNDISFPAAVPYPFDSAPLVNVSGAESGIDLVTGKFKVQTGTDPAWTTILTATPGTEAYGGLSRSKTGYSGFAASTGKAASPGGFTLSESQPNYLLPGSLGSVKLEKPAPTITVERIETIKP